MQLPSFAPGRLDFLALALRSEPRTAQHVVHSAQHGQQKRQRSADLYPQGRQEPAEGLGGDYRHAKPYLNEGIQPAYPGGARAQLAAEQAKGLPADHDHQVAHDDHYRQPGRNMRECGQRYVNAGNQDLVRHRVQDRTEIAVQFPALGQVTVQPVG